MLTENACEPVLQASNSQASVAGAIALSFTDEDSQAESLGDLPLTTQGSRCRQGWAITEHPYHDTFMPVGCATRLRAVRVLLPRALCSRTPPIIEQLQGERKGSQAPQSMVDSNMKPK